MNNLNLTNSFDFNKLANNSIKTELPSVIRLKHSAAFCRGNLKKIIKYLFGSDKIGWKFDKDPETGWDAYIKNNVTLSNKSVDDVVSKLTKDGNWRLYDRNTLFRFFEKPKYEETPYYKKSKKYIDFARIYFSEHSLVTYLWISEDMGLLCVGTRKSPLSFVDEFDSIKIIFSGKVFYDEASFEYGAKHKPVNIYGELITEPDDPESIITGIIQNLQKYLEADVSKDINQYPSLGNRAGATISRFMDKWVNI